MLYEVVVPVCVTLAASPLNPEVVTLSVALVAFHPEVVPPSNVPLGSIFAAHAALAGTSAMPATITERTAAPAALRTALNMWLLSPAALSVTPGRSPPPTN
jgi:hypothetical protein